ncbi:MAG: adenylate/guanylate cyclase domain-containing protein [Leptospiraceae bacterium]|nr:adenylate/guanylate cyclase domain-containing protein [Leptospiraceae bacterium]
MTVLFSDIRNFAEMSEKMSPEETFEFINNYLACMGPVISKHNGFIDKYIGDAIMALFESPQKAVTAAIGMLRALTKFNSIQSDKELRTIRIGIGVHTGMLILGTVGEEDRLQTTVIGDTVNIAARIEALTKVYKAPLIVSGESLVDEKRIGNFLFTREIDNVRVKGKEKPITLFEVMNTDSQEILEKKIQSKPLYEEALSLYKKGEFQEAIDCFIECGKICPEDEISEMYIRRCSTLLRVPPGDEWTGVSTL